ncbi:GNAT family N-acetyltransferase [Pelosinus propionicus]|uniref:Homocysteine/selenocysteine methylase (S-methylmethionine-dependent) n=1 Tax=Pelosinus propionicus DSM 13327 TaxID=1123291 RepID=A0A1I4PHW5_9FIRM|nr:GNAT family N-acetyltransferase [Pelosinus propionicus]SFM27421.1 Homocysteine/selenocysteine methylase (S-methylmethionine-dependent) [Pelosinus propionicus DSM 13327]
MDFSQALTDYPVIITEGAIIERLKRECNFELDPYVANAGYIYNPAQKQKMKNMYKQYIYATCVKSLPIVLFTPTWRASLERIRQAQILDRDVNLDCFRFLSEIRDEYEHYAEKIFIGGLIGCKGDAYNPEEALSAAEAEIFHSYQIERLICAGVNFLIAETLPSVSEALGIAKAMAVFDKPYILGFVIRDNGTLLDSTPLHKAIALIDEEVDCQPVGYVVNCVHPITFKKALTNPINSSLRIERIIGLLGNTSTKSPEELDNAVNLEFEEPQAWAEEMLNVKNEFGIKIIGGCCGTNHHHIQSLVVQLAMHDLEIRKAVADDSKVLTQISFMSKRYWNYPEQYFEIWKDELTITPSYIQNNIVYLAERDGQVLGYFSLVQVDEGFWLEHIFIMPKCIGKGIGSKLIATLKSKCKELKIDKVNILSDPNAKGFYDKLGACYLGESPSNIEGRTVSIYEFNV